MDVEVVIDEPWRQILRAIRQQEGRTVAAIAYVTKRLLDLTRGDVLVCASRPAKPIPGFSWPVFGRAFQSRAIPDFLPRQSCGVAWRLSDRPIHRVHRLADTCPSSSRS
jgi:hypothetical protein